MLSILVLYAYPLHGASYNFSSFGGLGTALAFLQYNYDIFGEMAEATSEKIVSMMVLLYGYEPAMQLIKVLFYDRYPDLNTVNAEKLPPPVTAELVYREQESSKKKDVVIAAMPTLKSSHAETKSRASIRPVAGAGKGFF